MSAQPKEPYSAGRKIGRYEIVRELGFGGMAGVYAVRLRSMGSVEKLFAIKVLLPHLRSDREFVSMFLDEARIAVLLDHPNVAHVFELGDDAGAPYIVMEYLHGQSLSALVKRATQKERPLSADLFLYLMSEVALGLHAAHELIGPDRTPLEVVHRDVSPQNVHVAYDGRVRVVDFGIARARGRSTHTATGQIKGKFSYCSPEQITRPNEVDRRADLWALGVMLWEHYARVRLFREDDEPATLWNVMNKTVPRLRTVAPDVPESIDRLVARCLDRDVEARPRTALEVAKVLRAAADERSATPERLATEMRVLFQHEILEAQAPVRATEEVPRDEQLEATEVAASGFTHVAHVEPPRAPLRRAPWAPLAAFAGLLAVGLGVAYLAQRAPSAIESATPPIATSPAATAPTTTASVVAPVEEAVAPPPEIADEVGDAIPGALADVPEPRTERRDRRRRSARPSPPAEHASPRERPAETLLPSPY